MTIGPPQVDCLQIEHAGVLIGRRESALEQLWQHLVEALDRQVQPSCRLLRRDVGRVHAEAYLLGIWRDAGPNWLLITHHPEIIRR
jgi:hypothetical protein